MDKIYILPTGDEIKNGVVLDLDAPEMIRQAVAASETADKKPDLIALIGGSGGGHRFSPTLGKDFTHSALQKYLDEYSSHEIYGKNGHMWTKLFCGKKGGTYVINVPGPFVEAKAAFAAFLKAYAENKDLDGISRDMAEAELALFPEGAAETV